MSFIPEIFGKIGWGPEDVFFSGICSSYFVLIVKTLDCTAIQFRILFN